MKSPREETGWGGVIAYFRDVSLCEAILRVAGIASSSAHTASDRLPTHSLSWTFRGGGGLARARALKAKLDTLVGVDVRMCGSEEVRESEPDLRAAVLRAVTARRRCERLAQGPAEIRFRAFVSGFITQEQFFDTELSFSWESGGDSLIVRDSEGWLIKSVSAFAWMSREAL